jgi:hypothetical protein
MVNIEKKIVGRNLGSADTVTVRECWDMVPVFSLRPDWIARLVFVDGEFAVLSADNEADLMAELSSLGYARARS